MSSPANLLLTSRSLKYLKYLVGKGTAAKQSYELGQGLAPQYRPLRSELLEASDRLIARGGLPRPPSLICVLGPLLPLASSSVQGRAGQAGTRRGACGSQRRLSHSWALFASGPRAAVGRGEGLAQLCDLSVLRDAPGACGPGRDWEGERRPLVLTVSCLLPLSTTDGTFLAHMSRA